MADFEYFPNLTLPSALPVNGGDAADVRVMRCFGAASLRVNGGRVTAALANENFLMPNIVDDFAAIHRALSASVSVLGNSEFAALTEETGERIGRLDDETDDMIAASATWVIRQVRVLHELGTDGVVERLAGSARTKAALQ